MFHDPIPYFVLCTLYIVLCTLYLVHWWMYIVQPPLIFLLLVYSLVYIGGRRKGSGYNVGNRHVMIGHQHMKAFSTTKYTAGSQRAICNLQFAIVNLQLATHNLQTANRKPQPFATICPSQKSIYTSGHLGLISVSPLMYYFTFIQATLIHLQCKTRLALVSHHHYCLGTSSNQPW